MSYLDNYKAMAAGLVRGLRIFRNGRYGSRLVGTIGLYADLVAEGARQAFISRLPGHPEQSEDAATQVGYDRQLARYKYETTPQYKTRLQNAWDAYQQGGTNIGLAREVYNCINCIWAPAGTTPDLTNVAQARFYENGWAEHTAVLFSPGQGSVTGSWISSAETYGNFSYGAPNKVWGFTNVLIEDVNAIRSTLRKWLPSRTKGWLAWSGGGPIYSTSSPLAPGGSLYTYGGGSSYTAGVINARISVE
jgi:hypothetical protein